MHERCSRRADENSVVIQPGKTLFYFFCLLLVKKEKNLRQTRTPRQLRILEKKTRFKETYPRRHVKCHLSRKHTERRNENTFYTFYVLRKKIVIVNC